MSGIYDLWELIVNNYVGFILIFIRLSGIFTLNPILGRAGVPVQVRVMLTFPMAVLVFVMMGGKAGYTPQGVADFFLVVVKEGFVGIFFGVIMYLFLTAIIYAGELMDMQSGLSMGKAMDPGSGVTMPLFANTLTYMFMLYFFLTGGHLTYIKLFALSYEAIPINFAFTPSLLALLYTVVMFLGMAIELGIKLAMPVVATELIVEFCMGIVMKAVPTIQVFVINIQVKIAVALVIVMLTAQPSAEFLQKMLDLMWQNIFGAQSQFVGVPLPTG